MTMSSMDIVTIAIGIFAVAGIVISFSAWRHAVKVERELSKDSAEGVASAV